MRAFGFRPAVEAGVLKREWRGLQVRVSELCVRARDADGWALEYHGPGAPGLLVNGRPLGAEHAGAPVVAGLLDLVGSYERWVEAREGRRVRIERAARHASPDADRRPVNALAETRRLQRLLHLSPRARR